MSKKFEVIGPSEQGSEKNKVESRILRIVNGKDVVNAEIPNVSQVIHKELHEKRYLESAEKAPNYEQARGEVCSSFGVPEDDIHRIVAPEEGGMQRAFRTFVVLVDRNITHPETGLHEAFYSEGRTAHSTLLNRIFNNMNEYGIKGIDLDKYIEESEKNDVPRWMFFKGFLLVDDEEISHLPEKERVSLKDFLANRKDKEEVIKDDNGEIPTDKLHWFLSGSNMDLSSKK